MTTSTNEQTATGICISIELTMDDLRELYDVQDPEAFWAKHGDTIAQALASDLLTDEIKFWLAEDDAVAAA